MKDAHYHYVNVSFLVHITQPLVQPTNDIDAWPDFCPRGHRSVCCVRAVSRNDLVAPGGQELHMLYQALHASSL